MLRYGDGRFTKASREDVVHLEPQHRLGALHLDRRATGEERSTLLMEHAYLGLVCTSDGLVHGAAWPMLGEGLIVANDPSVGMEMLRWHFPLSTYVLLHAGNAVHDDLTELGHTVETIGTRMVHGNVPLLRPELIFSEPFAPLLLQGSPSKM